MSEEIRLTRDIHNLTRGRLTCEESLRVLEEIVESPEWISHLEMELMLLEFFSVEKRGKKAQQIISEL